MPVKKSVKEVTPLKKTSKFSVPMYSLLGKETGVMELSEEIFGAKISKALLKQALRVYMTNQKSLLGSTKTRGNVAGSTAKVWKQKGTGRARHGAITGPIFVGGGITFGPTPRKVRLELPQKQKRAALISALSSKMADKLIIGLDIKSATGKTSEMAKLSKSLNLKSALVVLADKNDLVVRSLRNLTEVNVLPASQLNALDVLKQQTLILTKDVSETLVNKGEKNVA